MKTEVHKFVTFDNGSIQLFKAPALDSVQGEKLKS